MVAAPFLIVALLAYEPWAAQAQTMCGERDTVLSTLKKTYSETPVSMGLATNGAMIEVLASPSGSFTIVLTQPSGLACVIAAGEGWENFIAQAKEQKTNLRREHKRASPTLDYSVGDVVSFRTLCKPIANGIVLRAFMEGGPELADIAFAERVNEGECSVYTYSIWAKLLTTNYIGLFHGYHLWALQFGERGFSIIYFLD